MLHAKICHDFFHSGCIALVVLMLLQSKTHGSYLSLISIHQALLGILLLQAISYVNDLQENASKFVAINNSARHNNMLNVAQ